MTRQVADSRGHTTPGHRTPIRLFHESPPNPFSLSRTATFQFGFFTKPRSILPNCAPQ
jgi:hypothetical protein